METNELITVLRRMQVETGSLVCLGCGYEHGCNAHGCAILREAADKLERGAQELKAAIDDMHQIGIGFDFCSYCVHCCSNGKPMYRTEEPYLAFCETCDENYCNFKWRGKDHAFNCAMNGDEQGRC